MRGMALWLLLWPAAAPACETALLLAIDVSNSVDEREYRLQADGLADALLEPQLRDIILSDDVALAVMQWAGVERQVLSIPWVQPATAAEVQDLALRARLMPRAFELSDTAPAEALDFAREVMAGAPPCRRQVIDVSGDGTRNAGGDVRVARNRAATAGITVNGVAIESMGLAITGYYTAEVITPDGFVLTARTHREYPQAIRQKLIRELSRPSG